MNKNNKATQGLKLYFWINMGGYKKLFFCYWTELDICNTFYFTAKFLKTIPNSVHKGKCSGRSPLGPTPKSVHDKT